MTFPRKTGTGSTFGVGKNAIHRQVGSEVVIGRNLAGSLKSRSPRLRDTARPEAGRPSAAGQITLHTLAQQNFYRKFIKNEFSFFVICYYCCPKIGSFLSEAFLHISYKVLIPWLFPTAYTLYLDLPLHSFVVCTSYSQRLCTGGNSKRLQRSS